VLKRLRDGGREVAETDLPEVVDDNGPLGDLLASEAMSLVGAAVAALPPLQREVLLLVEYEEMSLAEVADAVVADVGTVKARLHRARAGLRQRLGPLSGTAPEGSRAAGGGHDGRK
jgi:RNA polymerase sigma-70 factor (ECF subfamily)